MLIYINHSYKQLLNEKANKRKKERNNVCETSTKC